VADELKQHSAEKDAHVGCQEAYEKQRRRAEFSEARMKALVVEFRQLARTFDGIDGHRTYPALGGKTLGGVIRSLTNGEAGTVSSD